MCLLIFLRIQASCLNRPSRQKVASLGGVKVLSHESSSNLLPIIALAALSGNLFICRQPVGLSPPAALWSLLLVMVREASRV